jgi:hypothetical protein
MSFTKLLIFTFLLCFFLQPSYANDLYTAYIASEKNDLSDSNIRQAFIQTLVKVSGNKKLKQSKYTQTIKTKKITSYVISKSYQEISPNNHYWAISFSPNKVNAILKKHNFSIWNKHRPSVVIIVQEKPKDKNAGDESDLIIIPKNKLPTEIQEAATHVSQTRGIKFKFITGSKTELLSMQILDQQTEQKIFLNRYNAEYYLSLTTHKSPYKSTATEKTINSELFTDVDENLSNPENTTEFSRNSTSNEWRIESEVYNFKQAISEKEEGKKYLDLKKATIEALDNAISIIASYEKKINSGSKKYDLFIHKIKNFRNYKKAVKTLQDSRWVKNINIKSINYHTDEIHIEILLTGPGEDYFEELYRKQVVKPLIFAEEIIESPSTTTYTEKVLAEVSSSPTENIVSNPTPSENIAPENTIHLEYIN